MLQLYSHLNDFMTRREIDLALQMTDMSMCHFSSCNLARVSTLLPRLDYGATDRRYRKYPISMHRL